MVGRSLLTQHKAAWVLYEEFLNVSDYSSLEILLETTLTKKATLLKVAPSFVVDIAYLRAMVSESGVAKLRERILQMLPDKSPAKGTSKSALESLRTFDEERGGVLPRSRRSGTSVRGCVSAFRDWYRVGVRSLEFVVGLTCQGKLTQQQTSEWSCSPYLPSSNHLPPSRPSRGAVAGRRPDDDRNDSRHAPLLTATRVASLLWSS